MILQKISPTKTYTGKEIFYMFEKTFGVSLYDYMDDYLSYCDARIVLDLSKFEIYVKYKHREYLECGFSLEEVIRIAYGEEIIDMIRQIV